MNSQQQQQQQQSSSSLLRDLYQTTILDHNRNPKNFGVLSEANRIAEGYNPLCGDRMKLYVQVDATGNNIITSISFDGLGCAISRASASLMTDSVKGRPCAYFDQLFDSFHEMVTTTTTTINNTNKLENTKLAVFSGVSEFPMRVKCATLCWHTLRAALAQQKDIIVETETTGHFTYENTN